MPAYTGYLISPFVIESFRFLVVGIEPAPQCRLESRVLPDNHATAAVLPTVAPAPVEEQRPEKHHLSYGHTADIEDKPAADNGNLKGVPHDDEKTRLLFPNSIRDPLRDYVHHQLRGLSLRCAFPEDMIPVFVSVPPSVRRLFRAPAVTRRLRVVMTPEQQRRPYDAETRGFERIVKSNQNVWPLYIRTAPLVRTTRLSLVVLFAGKDMVAVDWLPFISRFFNFVVSDENRRRIRRRPTAESLSRRIEPIFDVPEPVAEALGHMGAGVPVKAFHVTAYRGAAICAIHAAIIVVEYPGYGQTCGPPTVETITDAAVQTISAAVRSMVIRLPSLQEIDIRLLGYSLGAAVALNVAGIIANDIVCLGQQDFSMKPQLMSGGPPSFIRCLSEIPAPVPKFSLTRVVVVAPFTSVGEWATAFVGIPKPFRQLTGTLVSAMAETDIRWDNTEALRRLFGIVNSHSSAFTGLHFAVLHGTHDTLVPIWMGHLLATEAFRLRHGSADRPDIGTGQFLAPSQAPAPSSEIKRHNSLRCLEFPCTRHDPEEYHHAARPSTVAKRGSMRCKRHIFVHTSGRRRGAPIRLVTSPLVHLFELDATHQTVISDPDNQFEVFKCLFSPSTMVQSLDTLPLL